MAVNSKLRSAFLWRMLVKALTVRKGRTAIAVASIMVGAAVVFALTSLYLDISRKMSEELRAYGANFFVGPAASSPDRRFDLATYRKIVASIPGDKLAGASPFLYGVVRLDLGNAVLAGVDFSGLKAISPYWQPEGGWITVDFDERNCIVGRSLAEKMELTVGKTVTVFNRDKTFRTELRVKGIVETGEAADEQMFVNMSLAKKIFGTGGRIDLVMLSVVAEGTEADALAARINSQFPGVEAKPIRKISQSDGRILDKIEGFMALVAAIILVITTLCVNAILSAMVVERTPEIGLMKALGADDRAIVFQFLAETVLICLVGVGLGLLVGFALAQVLGQTVFSAWVSLRPLVVPLTVGISLVAAIAAAVIPIRSAIGIVPARVLKGE